MLISTYKDLLGIKRRTAIPPEPLPSTVMKQTFPLKNVRLIGLEPTQLALPRPKRDVSTNFTTGANLLILI